jgi:hypothetical protein
MWIMAFSTFPFRQSGVQKSFIKPDLLLVVAQVTELISLLFQNQLGYQTVPEMAGLAVLLLERRMKIPHRQIFVCEFLVTVEAGFSGQPSPFCCGSPSQGPRGLSAIEKHRHGKRQGYSEQDLSIF